MSKRVNNEVTIENARILFRNFQGAEGQYNAAGKRTFSIALDGDQAQELKEIGWNVKTKPAREEGGDELHHLPVEVAYGKGRPPSIFLISEKPSEKDDEPRTVRTALDEDTVMLLDYAELELIDLIIRPYNWDVNGQQGVKAYLKKGFFTLRQDELDRKYSHVPDATDEPLAIENVVDAEVVEEGEWENDGTQKALTR